MRTRVRFGIRLSWPITNAATFVFYVGSAHAEMLSQAVAGLVTALIASGKQDIASRIVFETESK